MNNESMRPTRLSDTRIMKLANAIVQQEAMKVQGEGNKKLAKQATLFVRNLRSV